MRAGLNLGKCLRNPEYNNLPLTAEERAEFRHAIYVKQEDLDDYANPQPITSAEIPRSSSHSGWMRNQEEAHWMWKSMLRDV